jgi:LuxR family maltose regulon positive regulatory protein
LFQQQWYRIQGLLRLFPRDFIARRASLLNLEALILCYSYSFDALVPILKQVEDLLASPDQEMSDQLRRELESELAFMWGFVFYWSADGARSLEKLNLAIEITPKEHPFVQGHALEHQIYANQMIGCYQEALELAKRAGERTAKYGTAYMVRIQISLMVAHLLEGNLQKAEQAAKLALELAQESRLYASIGWSSQSLGYIYYQWSDLESARHYYAQVLEYRNRTSFQAQAQGSFGLTRTLQALGEVAEALEVSQSAVKWAEEVGGASMLAEARALSARLALLDGRTADTHHWATALGQYNSPMIFIEVAHLSLATIWIDQGTQQSLAEAGTLLAGLREFCERTHNVWHLIEVVALEALLSDALGEHQKALSSLEEAIQLARQGGYIRVFVDLGASMHALLAELRQNEIEPVYLDRILKAFPAAQATDSPSHQFVGRNDLTNRECEILELLAQRLTNQEIAERLVLSPGTVKQHLYNIYRKLHVKSRRQAVSVAEELGILPRQ